MLADPKKQLDLLDKICHSIIVNDTELRDFADSMMGKDIEQLVPQYLPRAEQVIATFESNFTYDDFRNHVRKEPVQVRYLIFIRFHEAQQRLSSETQCPCEYPDTLKDFLYSELIAKNPGKIHWLKLD